MKYLLIAINCWLQFAAHAQPIVIQNTRTSNHKPLVKVKLSTVPPTGYIENNAGNGYYKPAQGSNEILVTSVEKVFYDFLSIRSALLNNIPHETADYRINGYDGILIKKDTSYQYNGNIYTVKNMVFAFGNTSYCYILASAVPDVYASEENGIKASFLSAIVDTFGYSQQQLSKIKTSSKTLKNIVDPAGTDFKLAETTDENHSIYTKDGAYPPLGADKSVFTSSKDYDIVDTSSWESYTKALLEHRTDIKNLHIDEIKPVAIDKFGGYEITASALTVTNDDAIKIYLVTLFTPDACYKLLGMAYADFKNNLVQFKKMAATFHQ